MDNSYQQYQQSQAGWEQQQQLLDEQRQEDEKQKDCPAPPDYTPDYDYQEIQARQLSGCKVFQGYSLREGE